jgi:hypothetical protein
MTESFWDPASGFSKRFIYPLLIHKINTAFAEAITCEALAPTAACFGKIELGRDPAPDHGHYKRSVLRFQGEEYLRSIAVGALMAPPARNAVAGLEHQEGVPV